MEQARHPTRRLTQFFQRRPAIFFTTLLAIGIALATWVPIAPWIWIGSAMALLMIAAFVHWGFAAGAVILVGLAAAQIERYQFPSDSIAKYASADERLAQIELSIDDAPRLQSPSPGELRELPTKQTDVARVRAVKTVDGWESCAGKIALTIEQPNLQLRPGQVVRATGMLALPAGPQNPGEFDYADWCRDQRILATFRISHADGIQIVNDGSESPVQWLREKSRHLLGLGFSENDLFDHALLRAFVFGDPDPQLRDLDDQFVRTGTIHYLAITGLHVAIIGGMALLVCRLLRRSPRFSLLAALAVVVLYGLLAEPSWPGWRSIIFCIGATMGLLGRRTMDSLQMFFAAVAMVVRRRSAEKYFAIAGDAGGCLGGKICGADADRILHRMGDVDAADRVSFPATESVGGAGRDRAASADGDRAVRRRGENLLYPAVARRRASVGQRRVGTDHLHAACDRNDRSFARRIDRGVAADLASCRILRAGPTVFPADSGALAAMGDAQRFTGNAGRLAAGAERCRQSSGAGRHIARVAADISAFHRSGSDGDHPSIARSRNFYRCGIGHHFRCRSRDRPAVAAGRALRERR